MLKCLPGIKKTPAKTREVHPVKEKTRSAYRLQALPGGRSGVTELSKKASKIKGLLVVNKLCLEIIGVQKWTPIILLVLKLYKVSL